MDLKKSFAERLHNARLMRGMSMQQLCDMMGNIITKQTLFKYEKGVMLPKSGIVIALCDALEINPDYLCAQNGNDCLMRLTERRENGGKRKWRQIGQENFKREIRKKGKTPKGKGT
jgi:transcriptional regulator with XRE-family HTH domain